MVSQKNDDFEIHSYLVQLQVFRIFIRLHSSMDRTPVCGIGDGGPIPPGGTDSETKGCKGELGLTSRIDPWRGRIVV